MHILHVHVCQLLYFYSGLTFLEMHQQKVYMYVVSPNDSYSQLSAISKKVRALQDSNDDEGNHISWKFKMSNRLELQTAEVSSIKDSLIEVLSWSENTKLPIVIHHILRAPFNAPYVLQYQ